MIYERFSRYDSRNFSAIAGATFFMDLIANISTYSMLN